MTIVDSNPTAGQTVGRLFIRVATWSISSKGIAQTKDFFVNDFHPRRRSGENCRFHKIASGEPNALFIDVATPCNLLYSSL